VEESVAVTVEKAAVLAEWEVQVVLLLSRLN
jgi:hypothetical protein